MEDRKKNENSCEDSDLEDEVEKSFVDEIKTYFRDYCNHTGIHGFQYFGQHRTIIEKCWWILVFLVIFVSCSSCIYLIYDKWATSPVIVSLATKETPIYQIPFPAVTICPTIKYSRRCFNHDEKHVKNIDNVPRNRLLGYTQTLCKKPIKTSKIYQEKYYKNHFFETLLQCSPFANGNFSVKFMNRKKLRFGNVFHPIVTEDGICFTFNMMDIKEIFSDEVSWYPGFGNSDEKSTWIPQVGYPEDAELETYPRRALLAGGLNSLEFALNHFEEDIDYSCNGAEQGYKVLLHIPSRIARPTLEYIMVPFNKATTITVIPDMMSTSSRVKKYNPESRNCYFPGEKDLKFYRVYTKNSCDVECLTNYTLQHCKCVAFWMPRISSTPICGPLNLGCVTIARENYDLSKLKDKLREDRLKRKLAAAKTNQTIDHLKFWEQKDHEATKEEIKDIEDEISSVKSKCNCFPICSDLTYTGTASSLDFDWEEQISSKASNNMMNGTERATQITIFLKTNEVFTMERNELYGPTDFISNFGGLLGLFSGFSILSLLEIVYYLTFRIIGNCKKFGRWYGQDT